MTKVELFLYNNTPPIYHTKMDRIKINVFADDKNLYQNYFNIFYAKKLIQVHCKFQGGLVK